MPPSDPSSPSPEIRPTAWLQWLRRCQLALCDDHCRDYLETTLIKRFRSQAIKASRGAGFEIFAQREASGSSASSHSDLPYLFENWLRFFKKEVNRQCIKSYLRLQSKGDVAHIEALITLLLRDFVANLWRHEGTEQIGGSSADSLNRPISDDVDRTVSDMLSSSDPEPGQEADLADLEEICVDCARGFYSETSADERLLLGGRAQGWGPTHPEILAKASVGKSVLYEMEKGITVKLHSYLRKTFADDLKHEPQMLDLMAKYTGEHLLRIARAEFFPENTDA